MLQGPAFHLRPPEFFGRKRSEVSGPYNLVGATKHNKPILEAQKPFSKKHFVRSFALCILCVVDAVIQAGRGLGRSYLPWTRGGTILAAGS